MNHFAGVHQYPAAHGSGLNINTGESAGQYRNESNCLSVEGANILGTDALDFVYCGEPNWNLSGEKRPISDAAAFEALNDAYQEQGSRALSRIGGHFACALIDKKSKRCYLLTDRIGVHRLFWRQLEGALLFGTSLAALRRFSNVREEVSADALYGYMYFHMVPTPLSIYRDIHKLAPGHLLTHAGSEVGIELTYKPDFVEHSGASLESLEQEFVDIVSRSVKSAMQTGAQPGAFLSGGLDSSTVAGFMARHSQTAAQTYSIGFDAKEYDETPFARISAKHFGTHSHEYFVTPQDVVDIVPEIARFYDEPFGNSSVVPSYYCAKMAKQDGIDLMLAGDGGDELFAGNERYAKQRYFRHYLGLPPWIRSALIDLPARVLPGSIPLVRKARSYIEQAKTPLPDRLQAYNFLNRHAAEEIFSTDFISAIDTQLPLTLQRQVYGSPDGAGDLNRMLYWDWHFTLADNDLRKVSNMCQLAGVKVAYPLLSDELIDFSCKVPPNLKLKGDRLRFFFKHALRGFLHPDTLTKSKHGFGLPFGVWLRDYEPLKAMAFDSIEKLKRRGYFNPEFLDNSLAMHQNQHAAYYGELVWLFMMLELWLQAH